MAVDQEANEEENAVQQQEEADQEVDQGNLIFFIPQISHLNSQSLA